MGDGDSWAWRGPVVVLVAILVAFSASVAVVAGWSRITLIDTDGYVDALVAPLTSDPDVKDAVATELARQMTENTGTSFAERLKQWVPASNPGVQLALDQWGAQLEQGWRQGLRPAIRTQLDEPSFNELWVNANGEAHRQLIAALKEGGTDTQVTLDLHGIAQEAVREIGVQLDQQLSLPGNVAAMVYGAVAAALPPDVGKIAVDVSRVSQPARQSISLIDPILGVAAGAALILVLVAIGVAPSRRQGIALIIIGLFVAAAAGVLWLGISSQADTAGDRAAAVAVKPFSEEMRLVVNREAALAAGSFKTWAVGMAAAGGVLVLVGLVWRIAAGRRQDPYEDVSYGSTGWDDTPVAGWSSRPY